MGSDADAILHSNLTPFGKDRVESLQENKKTRLRILTERFDIEQLQPKMVDDTFLGWVKQPAIGRQFPEFAKQTSLRNLRSFIEKQSTPQSQFFIIRERQKRKAIGFILVTIGPAQSATTHHALGDRRWWGKGVVHEARAGLIELLFRKGIHKINGLPRASSRGAVRAYRDQGFTQEGVLRDRYFNSDGTYDDAIAFGLFREEWDFNAAKKMPEIVRKRNSRLVARGREENNDET